MSKGIKKLFLILIIACCLTLSACGGFYGITHSVPEETDAAPTDASFSPAPSDEYNNMPSLPELGFSEMDFFEDGYEIVKYNRTTDGDTASFIMGGLNVKCRFIGIDTPELDHDGGKDEPFAKEAAGFTEKMLKSANVIILERDEAAGEYDNYGRLLAHVWADGELVGYMLVSEGLATARYYREEYKYYYEISAAEKAAGKQEKGVWGK